MTFEESLDQIDGILKRRISEIECLRGENASLRAQIALLRASHAELLAAAKDSIALADQTVMHRADGTPMRTPECQEIYDRVVASIAHAEEPAP